MELRRYVKYFLIGMVLLVGLIVCLGLYINIAGNKRIADKLANKFSEITAVRATSREMKVVIEDVNITVKPDWHSDIEAQVPGTVSRFFVREGEFVKGGQPICEIVNNDVLGQLASAEALVSEAEADYYNAKRRAERYEELIHKDAVSKADYDTAVASSKASAARLASRIAQRDLMRSQKEKLIVTAPQDCRAIRLYVRHGSYVNQGQPLLQLASVNKLTVITSIYPEVLAALKLHFGDQTTRFIMELPKVLLQPRAYPAFPSAGEADASALAANQFYVDPVRITPKKPANGQEQKLEWELKNGFNVIEPTSYMHATFTSLAKRRVLAVPIESVNDYYNDNDNYVYCVNKEGLLEKRLVRTGISDGKYVEIMSGLQEGEIIIVTDDLRTVEAGMRVLPIIKEETNGK